MKIIGIKRGYSKSSKKNIGTYFQNILKYIDQEKIKQESLKK